MFIAIAKEDYQYLTQNADAERAGEFATDTEHPIFLAGTEEEAVKCITNYYNMCLPEYDAELPKYVISEACGETYVTGKFVVSVSVI